MSLGAVLLSYYWDVLARKLGLSRNHLMSMTVKEATKWQANHPTR